jgi:hypothetical protein
MFWWGMSAPWHSRTMSWAGGSAARGERNHDQVVYPRIVSTDLDFLRLLGEWHSVKQNA